MSTSLADLMLAQLGTRSTTPTTSNIAEPQPVVDANVNASALRNPHLTQSDDAIIRISLDALRIDHHQPRNYLPQDLREALVHHGDARKALQTLIERAAQHDAVAASYLDSIRTLAHSIAGIGLQQPIRISQDKPETHRIVDGERRFWAYVYLRETTREGKYDAINAIAHDPQATADDIQRAQWAANLCREDIPAVDFAEAVHQIREQYLSNLLRDRKRVIAELGADADGKSTPELVIALTQREVARLTGHLMSERHLYTHLAITEKLKPEAKSLARAYRISMRQLSGIVRLSEAEQVRLIMQMAGISEPTTTKRDEATATRPGRPTSLQRGINACIGLTDALHKLTEQALTRYAVADVQTLLDELDGAAAQLERARRMVKARLPEV